MMKIPGDVEAEFVAAGWSPMRCNTLENQVGNPHAKVIFESFGGLDVGSCGAGLKLARSNVRFLTHHVPAKSQVVSAWKPILGDLTAVADAHNDHMIVFVAEDGCYYFYTDSDEKLYLGGKNFTEAIRRLLLGIEYGGAVEPNKKMHGDKRVI